MSNVVATKARESAACIVVNWIKSGLCKHGQYDYRMMFVKRSSKMKFMPNVVTFPGGVVDEIDRAGSPGHGLDCVRAKCQREDVMYRMAAVRELAEETGLVLDTDVELTPWSMFLAPLSLKMRFNTLFYMIFLQPDTDVMNLCKQVLDQGVRSVVYRLVQPCRDT